MYLGISRSARRIQPKSCLGGCPIREKLTKSGPATFGVQCSVSVGSLLHDWCCVRTNNQGYACDGNYTTDSLLCQDTLSTDEPCREEWNTAACDWLSDNPLIWRSQWNHLFDEEPVYPCDCGNYQINGSEECDEPALDNQSCSSFGFPRGGTLKCTADCTFDTSGCDHCGNSVIDDGEVCDSDNLGDQTCQSLGYASGVLGCGPDCKSFDTFHCLPVSNGEVCNLADDDADGEVDDGFDWVLSPWQTVVRTTNFAVYPRAIGLRDGRIAIAGVDSYGGWSDRGFLVVVSASGQVVAGPVWTRIANSGADYTSIAENPNGEIAALYSSTNYAGCKTGCPTYLTRVRTSDLGLVSSSQVSYRFAPQGAFDLAWTPSGYVTLVRSVDKMTQVVWLDESAASKEPHVTLPGVGMNAGSLAASENGLAWIRSLSGLPGTVDFGVLASDGSSQVLGPITAASGSVQLGGFRNIAWMGDRLVAIWAETPAQGQPVPKGMTISKDGSWPLGPMTAGPSGYYPNDLAVVDNNIVLLAVDATGAIAVQRLSGGLSPVAPLGNPIQLPAMTSYSTLAMSSSALMLVHGYTNLVQHEIRAAAIGCP